MNRSVSFGKMLRNGSNGAHYPLSESVPKEIRGRLLKDWVLYCRTIPLRGAIILNETLTKCLLGRVIGYNKFDSSAPR